MNRLDGEKLEREIILVFFTFPTNGTEQNQSVEIKSHCDLQIFYQAPSTECAEIKSVYWWCKVYSKRGAWMTQLCWTERKAFRLDLLMHDGSPLPAQRTFSIETVRQQIRNCTAISIDGWSYITQCMVERALLQGSFLGMKHCFAECNEGSVFYFASMNWIKSWLIIKRKTEGVAQ